MGDLDQLVEELGAVLAAPDLPRLQRNEPGRDKKWDAGDIAMRIPPSLLEDVANKVGVSPALLRSYADVARAYPLESRTIRAAWTIYRELRMLPPEERKLVLRDGLTLRQARLAIGKGPMDRPRRERESDEERAWAIIEELQVPAIHAIVEREMQSSAADRKARKAARSALGEINERRKYIERELRKLAKDGTPEHQYWEASRELVKAEQYIYSLARLHHHAEAMTEDRWTDIVATLRGLSDSAQVVADRIGGLADGDFIEGEEEPEYLALTSGIEDIVDAEIIGDEE